MWSNDNIFKSINITKHGTDNPLPIFTPTLHRSHFNKGCYGMLHTPLKCNLVNFDIPNRFCTMEIHLGHQNRQDYISKGYITYRNILY